MLSKKRTEKKIVVVTRETRIDDLRKRFTSLDQLSFYVETRGGRVKDYLEEDSAYKGAVNKLSADLQSWGRVQFVDRAFLPNFVFGPADTVVAVGQDGLVANTLKYLRNGQPLIGVNPDPDRIDGVLLPFRVADLDAVLGEVLAGRYRSQAVTMALARLNDGQEILAVNDFFIGPRTHTSARYWIEWQGKREQQSSSGVIVSTGLGSTGWLRSLVEGAFGVSAAMSAQSRESVPNLAMAWDSPALVFTVREPFPSRQSTCELVFGQVDARTPLRLRSLMPERGVIFSDGVEADFLEFNSGAEVEIGVAALKGKLVLP